MVPQDHVIRTVVNPSRHEERDVQSDERGEDGAFWKGKTCDKAVTWCGDVL